MTTKDFNNQIEKTFKDCLRLILSKNKDYAENNSPFKNFKISLLVGVPVDRAILVRITDKLSRISNLLDRPPEVKDEKIDDSIDDMINYLAILKTWINNK